MTDNFPDLIDPRDLAAMLATPGLVVLDASWYMPADPRDPEAEFAAGHIPGARRFDFDGEVCAPGTDLPHMLPTPDAFAAAAQARGVGTDSRVVIYDGAGIFAAPRAWWMFKAMGHEQVAVLDGGMPGWRAAGLPLETGTPGPATLGDFTARPVAARLTNAEGVLEVVAGGGAQIVDARAAPRFEGAQAEPRPGLRSGHMPGARNLPFDRLLSEGRLLPPEALRAAFAAAGISGDAPLVASCGSGVTASVLALGAEVAGLGPVAVYDGSWAEWGQETRPDLPVVQGAAQ